MTEIQITIPGKAQPKERPRDYAHRTPPKTRAYEALVATCGHVAMKGRKPFLGYLHVKIKIITEIPRSWRKSKVAEALAGIILPTGCDLDNQVKSLCDGLNAVAYGDDRQIVSMHVSRCYGLIPVAFVTVKEIDRIDGATS